VLRCVAHFSALSALQLFKTELRFFFSPYYQVPVIIQRQVAHLVAEAISVAIFRGVRVGDIFKVKSLVQQLLFIGLNGLLMTEYRIEYLPVLREHAVNVFHYCIVHALQCIVISIAAVVVAEFFIAAAMQGLIAGEAVF
jgi:hypothetical protein